MSAPFDNEKAFIWPTPGLSVEELLTAKGTQPIASAADLAADTVRTAWTKSRVLSAGIIATGLSVPPGWRAGVVAAFTGLAMGVVASVVCRSDSRCVGCGERSLGALAVLKR